MSPAARNLRILWVGNQLAEVCQTDGFFRAAMAGKHPLNPLDPQRMAHAEETLSYLSDCPDASLEELRLIAAHVRRVAQHN